MSLAHLRRTERLEDELEKFRAELEQSQQALIEQYALLDKRLDLVERHKDPYQNRPPFPIPRFPKKLREIGYSPPGG